MIPRTVLKRNSPRNAPKHLIAASRLTSPGGPDGYCCGWMKTLVLFFFLSVQTLLAQKMPEGIWQGYDGEWKHVSQQLIALAEVTPAEKFAWRPAPGVRSTSEVYMHIVLANFYLLSVTGPKMPAGMKPDEMEKTVTAKADVIDWLKRSLDAVKTARASLKPGDLERSVKIFG